MSVPSCTAADSTILLDQNSNVVLHNIAIKTNENVSKLQCSNFVIVIDVSGSMDVRAGTTDADDVIDFVLIISYITHDNCNLFQYFFNH